MQVVVIFAYSYGNTGRGPARSAALTAACVSCRFGRSGRQGGTVVDTPADIVLRSGMVQAVVEGMLYQPSQEQDQFMADQVTSALHFIHCFLT